MTDDLDKLRRALRDATPPADARRRAETLARAMQAFDRHQENPADMRPTQDPPRGAGGLRGIRAMISKLSLRPVLAATASAAALAVGLVAVMPVLRSGVPTGLTATLPVLAENPPIPAPMNEPVVTAPDSPANFAAPQDAARSNSTVAIPVGGPSDAAPAAGMAADALAGVAGEATFATPITHEFAAEARLSPSRDAETYANADPNPVRIAADDPVSTFSVDVDTASYSVVRSSLTSGRLPSMDAVRIEEMINYFHYQYPAPAANGAPLRPSVAVTQTPWNTGTRLVRIGLQGREIAGRPPLDLVFLVDTSGSMDDAAKLPLLRQAFALMLGQLAPEDRVAMVAYAGSSGLVLPPTPAADRPTILDALDHLGAGGATAGQAGLQQAYQVAETMRRDGAVRRVILATDGDFNVGISDPAALADFVARKRATGTYLSVLGFGRGNLDDATMQALAQNGNGQAAYIDTLSEAQKVLVEQLAGAMFPIADDVKVQVEFNPATVAEYRLIGYETRNLRREDFSNDRVDAGEVGAGMQVTALYEVTPVASPAVRNEPLRYAVEAPASDRGDSAELGYLKLRWKAPGAAESQFLDLPIGATPSPADTDTRWAAAMAGFGQLLSGGFYLGGWGWADAIALAEAARGEDRFGYRAEAVQLMHLAQSLSR